MTTPPSIPVLDTTAEREWRLPPIRGMVTLLSGEGVSRLLSFVAIALLTRRLGPAAWAPVAVALTATQFGTLLVEMGMRLLGAREVARDASAAGRLIQPVLSTQFAVSMVLVALAVLTASLRLVDPDLGRLLPGYAVSLAALPFFVPWVFQGRGAMEWVAVPQVIRYAVFLVFSALIVTSPARAPWLPWIEAVGAVAGALVAMWALHRFGLRVSLAPAKAFERTVFREAVPIAASQLIWVGRMYLPTAALWYLVSRESVARFDVAHRVLMVLQAMLTMYLANLYTPLSKAVQAPRRRLVGLLLGSTVFATTLAIAGALALAARPGQLLGILNGAMYNTSESALNLTILAFVVPVLTCRGHGHYALVALGRQRLELACSIAGAALLVALLVLWVPGGGTRAAALAMLLSESFGLVLTWIALGYALRRHGAVAGSSAAVVIS